MKFTVKELADLAGVTRRTLHHYDQIDLLPPSEIGENGYRYYHEQDLARLQQVLFYRELGFDLARIRELLDDPGFDPVLALEAHRRALLHRSLRLDELIRTVERTIRHLKGEINMSPKDYFEAFDDETQKKYEEEAAQRWDPQVVKDSNARWRSYSKEKQQAIMQESGEIYAEIVAHMDEGPDGSNVQAALGRWHQNLRNFYEPSVEALRGLGMMYESDPRFAERFAGMHPDLPGFLAKAIGVYCEGLG